MKTLFILAAAIAASATPALAQQAPVGQASSQVLVSYADLDLSSDRDVRRLDRRLRDAVETVCGPVSDADPRGKNDARQCRTDTLAEARAQRDVAVAGLSAAPQIRLASRH